MIGREAKRGGIGEGLREFLRRNGLQLSFTLIMLAGFGLWVLIANPFDVGTLTDEDKAMLAVQSQWPVRFSEDFSDPDDEPAGMTFEDAEETEVLYMERWAEDGRWNWAADFFGTADCCRDSAIWFFPEEDITDFWLSVDLTRVYGDEGAQYGVVYHYQDRDNFYEAGINDIGSGGIEVYGDGEWDALLTPALSSAESIMHPGEANTFQISVQDGKAIIFLNGVYYGQTTDNRVPSGRVGIVLPKPYYGDHVELGIDNIALRMP
jgi:hypothetical protein